MNNLGKVPLTSRVDPYHFGVSEPYDLSRPELDLCKAEEGRYRRKYCIYIYGAFESQIFFEPDDYITVFSLRNWGKLRGDVLTTEQASPFTIYRHGI